MKTKPNNSTMRSTWAQRAITWPMTILGHAMASFLVTLLLISILAPASSVFGALRFSMKVDGLRDMAISSMLQLGALGVCLWAMIAITYKLFTQRQKQAKYKSLKKARGTIMTETVIILPVYFLFSFGLAQLGINLIHGTMGNVAGYMASRSYWLWEGEIDKNRSGTSVDSNQAKDKARIAGALIMASVAPGDYITTGSMTNDAKAARKMTAPLGFDTSTLSNIMNALDGGNLGETSFYKSFGATPFLMRGATKFTHAYQVSSVTPLDDGGGVKFTYEIVQTMPVVGKIFGEFKGAHKGMVAFHWSTMERSYNFTRQNYQARPDMPDSFFSSSPPGETDPTGAIKGEAGDF